MTKTGDGMDDGVNAMNEQKPNRLRWRDLPVMAVAGPFEIKVWLIVVIVAVAAVLRGDAFYGFTALAFAFPLGRYALAEYRDAGFEMPWSAPTEPAATEPAATAATAETAATTEPA